MRTILAEVEAAEALAAESLAIPRGRIRVNAPVTFGAHELALVLPGYLAANPGVEVELTLTDRTVDLIDEGYDAVFRVGPLGDSGLIARSLQPTRMVLCAAPVYVEARGTPATPDDLRGHECLGFVYGSTRTQWSFLGPTAAATIDVSCRHIVNNGRALLNLAVAGMGILLQPASLVQDALASRRLVHLLPDYEPPTHPMHILYAPDRRITPKPRSFLDFIAIRFGGSHHAIEAMAR
ncbi:LysR substrate-binding domain-containing protein [Methylobacterium sp. WL7]|uniref:LysR substrate-binding domain-containing protein n=1 Tax=Methylobacterium sp. WL7 TaxID=2603900 RepID=UPI0032B25D32